MGECCSKGCCGAPLRSYRNTKVVGHGGELQPITGRTVCLIFGFNYEGYPAEAHAGCPPLTSCLDGLRFGDLALACGAEVFEWYDQPRLPRNRGWPYRSTFLQELLKHGQTLRKEDMLVLYYAGHGTQVRDSNGDEKDGMDEVLCFVKPDGSKDFLLDDDVAETLAKCNPAVRILIVTDCCHAGTACDLDKPELRGRPIVHLSAVRDSQEAEDLGDGGAFTSSLLEIVEEFTREGETDLSVADVFNACFGKYDSRQESQDFKFERTEDFDPDTFPWPFFPPEGWEVQTRLDNEIRLGTMVFDISGLKKNLTRVATLTHSRGATGDLKKKKKSEAAVPALKYDSPPPQPFFGGGLNGQSIHGSPMLSPFAPTSFLTPNPYGAQQALGQFPFAASPGFGDPQSYQALPSQYPYATLGRQPLLRQ